MRVLYDHQVFDMQRIGGVSRYFVELLKNLPTDVMPSVSVKYTNNQYLKDFSALANQLASPPDYYTNFMGGRVFRGKKKLYNLKKKYFPEPNLNGYNKALTIAALKRGDFDIFHPTYYDDYFLDYIGTKPFVITVYDMIHEIFPEYYMNDIKNRMLSKNKKILLQKASAIIAISANTKDDILNLCGIDEDRITVTHLANSLSADYNPTFPEKLPEKFLLFVGGRDNYKNFYFFINAIHPLLIKDQSIHIICTGKKFTAEEREFISSLNLSKQIHQYFVEDDLLAYLYGQAWAFVFPSLYEGFGIPVLESFSCGCPALLSKTSSLPEVGGDAALYFDPKNASSVRETVKQVIYDEEKRKDMMSKGYKQLGNFSWNKVGILTYQIYNKILCS